MNDDEGQISKSKTPSFKWSELTQEEQIDELMTQYPEERFNWLMRLSTEGRINWLRKLPEAEVNALLPQLTEPLAETLWTMEPSGAQPEDSALLPKPQPSPEYDLPISKFVDDDVDPETWIADDNRAPDIGDTAEDMPSRLARDCLIHFMYQLQDEESVSDLWFDKAAHHFFSAPPETEIADFLSEAAKALQEDDPESSNLAKQLSNAIKKTPKKLIAGKRVKRVKKPPAQYHDGFSARKFDSAFAAGMVMNISSPVIETARKIGQAVVDEFFDIDSRRQTAILRGMASFFRNSEGDRFWSQKTNIGKFIYNPTPDTFEEVMTTATTGYDVLKIYHLIAEYSPQASRESPWMTDANINYQKLILTERTPGTVGLLETDLVISLGGTDQKSADYGILHPSHPQNESLSEFQPGMDATQQKSPSLENLSRFEENSNDHGLPNVCGLAGSTNIAIHLGRWLVENDPAFKNDPHFKLEHVLLGSLMTLVFDGGHSVNEVMAIYTSIMQEVDLDRRREVMVNYSVDYKKLIELARKAGCGPEVEQALTIALRKTIAHFRHSPYAKWTPRGKRRQELEVTLNRQHASAQQMLERLNALAPHTSATDKLRHDIELEHEETSQLIARFLQGRATTTLLDDVAAYLPASLQRAESNQKMLDHLEKETVKITKAGMTQLAEDVQQLLEELKAQAKVFTESVPQHVQFSNTQIVIDLGQQISALRTIQDKLQAPQLEKVSTREWLRQLKETPPREIQLAVNSASLSITQSGKAIARLMQQYGPPHTADISQHPITTIDESPSEQQQRGKAKASVSEPHETSIATVSDDELADWEEKHVEIAVRKSLAVATNESQQVEQPPQPSTSTAIESPQHDVSPPAPTSSTAMTAKHQPAPHFPPPPENQDQAEGRRQFGNTATVRPGITIIGRSYTNVSPSHITINGTAYFEIATVTDPITKHPSKQVMYLTAEDQGDKRIEMGKTYRINIERTAGNRGVRAVIAEVKEEKLSTPSKSKGKPKR